MTQKKRKINYEDFELVKFKTNNDGTTVTYYDKSNPGFGKETVEVNEKLHEDLFSALSKLHLYFATRLGHLTVLDEMREKFKKQPKVLEFVLEKHKEQVERVKVSGISFSGQNQLRKVIITGSTKAGGYGSYSLGAPGIILKSDLLGYEEDIIALAENVSAEVYNLVFLGKHAPKEADAQTNLEDGIKEAEGNTAGEDDLK